MSDIDKIISTLNPSLYYDGTKAQISKFKKLIQKQGFEKSLEKAKPKSDDSYKIVYDSTSETLEQVYFWILDFMNDMFDVEKLVDNFTSSPGSGHFAEIGMRASRMQEQASNILGKVNLVIKSIINIIYDLKEFEMRLEHYDSANSEDKEEAEAGILALKQIWMDSVDIKRGNTSIKALALGGQPAFTTLIDAFLAAKSIKDIDKLDLNDRVKRILKPKMAEFLDWKKRSEAELRKRFEIEKSYLKSQVATLQLYSRWAKPYLRAAAQLEPKETSSADIVNVFNTMLLELTILGKQKINTEKAAFAKEIPEIFKKTKLKRDYYSCVLVDFKFRGIPQRISPQQAHYVFGGRVDVEFKAFCLNEDELNALKTKLQESDINDAFKLVEKTTTESLDQIKEDIEHFLSSEGEKKEKEKPESEDANPFLALLGIYNKKEKPAEKKEEAKDLILPFEKKKIEMIKPDNYLEKVIRDYGRLQARDACFTVFDTYKKAHGMASQPLAPEFS